MVTVNVMRMGVATVRKMLLVPSVTDVRKVLLDYPRNTPKVVRNVFVLEEAVIVWIPNTIGTKFVLKRELRIMNQSVPTL